MKFLGFLMQENKVLQQEGNFQLFTFQLSFGRAPFHNDWHKKQKQ
jgi:hypothetical protein